MKKIFFIIAIFFTTTLHAQIELSAEKCREMALENNYDIQIADLQYEKMLADQKAVFSNFLPKISGSATYAYIFKDITMGMDMEFNNMLYELPFEMALSMKGMYMAGINIQQPIFVGGKIYTGNKMAKKGVEMTEENKRLTRMNVMLEAEKSYWMYVSVQEKIKLLESYVAMLDSLYLQVSEFSRLEMAMTSDIQKVKAKQSTIKYELQRATSGLDLLRMSLCHTIGVNMDTAIIVTDTTIILPEYNLHQSLDISQRPEVLILQKQVELNKLAIHNTRADFLPTLGFSAGHTYIGGIKTNMSIMDYNVGEGKLNMNLPMIMANISIPIFHFGEGAKKIKSAKIAHSISEIELRKNSELMNMEVKQTLSEFQSSFLMIEAAEEAMKEADDVMKIANDNYELQMGTLFDILEAHTQWQEAYSNLIEARTNCKIREMEYLKATGRLE